MRFFIFSWKGGHVKDSVEIAEGGSPPSRRQNCVQAEWEVLNPREVEGWNAEQGDLLHAEGGQGPDRVMAKVPQRRAA